MLLTKGLKYKYASKAIDFPDLELHEGGACLVKGKSGSGKTTLLHILGGLLNPSEGSVAVNDSTLTDFNSSQLEDWRNKHVGLVLQQPIFPKYLTFKEHLNLILKHKGIKEDSVNELAQTLGVEDRLNALPNAVSGGERQRMALLNALIYKPTLLLIDEATANLDDDSATALIDLIEAHRPKNGYLIIASHDMRVSNRLTHKVDLG